MFCCPLFTSLSCRLTVLAQDRYLCFVITLLWFLFVFCWAVCVCVCVLQGGGCVSV